MKEILSKKNVGIRLKRLRLQCGLSQKRIAAELNVSRSNYSQVELGNQYPTYEVLVKLSGYYRKSYAWLLHGEDSYQSDKTELYEKLQSQAFANTDDILAHAFSGEPVGIYGIVEDMGSHVKRFDTILNELKSELAKITNQVERSDLSV